VPPAGCGPSPRPHHRGLLAARQRVNGEPTVPSGHRRLEIAGNLDNLKIAAGEKAGQLRGPVFMDSDVYKWLEAAAWEYARHPSRALLDAQRQVTAVVAAGQQRDGYLHSMLRERYRNLPWSHEHYCAGHPGPRPADAARAVDSVAARTGLGRLRTAGRPGRRVGRLRERPPVVAGRVTPSS
jgi:hypothetical protein